MVFATKRIMSLALESGCCLRTGTPTVERRLSTRTLLKNRRLVASLGSWECALILAGTEKPVASWTLYRKMKWFT